MKYLKGIAACVVAYKDEAPDQLIRRFMRKFKESGIVDELRSRAHYEKPSVKRRKKHLAAIRFRKEDDLDQ